MTEPQLVGYNTTSLPEGRKTRWRRRSAPHDNVGCHCGGETRVNSQSTIPCYVSGRGMHATDRTREFKVEVIHLLESSGLGYDTRYRYYRVQFPEMDPRQLARMICDPIEN